MSRKLDNAVRFLDLTINHGNPSAALDTYVAAASTATAARTSQLRHRLTTVYRPLVNRYDRRFMRPIRGFEDGNRVVVHSFQSFGYRDVERIVFDIFDTDGSDRITGHLSVAAPLAPTLTGRSQVDGPWLVEDISATVANKRLIAVYIARISSGDAAGAAALTSPGYADHAPNLRRSGADHYRFGSAAPSLGPPDILGCGNFVAVLSAVAAESRIARSCDLYRVTDGRVTEHWGAAETETSVAWAVGVRPDNRIGPRPRPVVTVSSSWRYAGPDDPPIMVAAADDWAR
jgi:predicted SnoaL-like aldol condensation-catalyzing enzyme